MSKDRLKIENGEEPCQRCENLNCASSKIPQAECNRCVMTAKKPLENQLLAHEGIN